MTKALTALWIVAGALGHVAANAQQGGVPGAGTTPDFSGVYTVGLFGIGALGPTAIEEPDPYPFTLQGERAHNAYDPLVSDIRQTDDCAQDPMPEILWSGNPIEIIQEDDSIAIRYEDVDTVRSIAMNGPPPPADQPRTPLGYSVGRWEGEVLTVQTTHTTASMIFSNRGRPISPGARITERYYRQPGNHLRLAIEIDDPVNYTEVFTITRMMMWAPDEQVRPWECFSLGPRDSEPQDIDDIARMLEAL